MLFASLTFLGGHTLGRAGRALLFARECRSLESNSTPQPLTQFIRYPTRWLDRFDEPFRLASTFDVFLILCIPERATGVVVEGAFIFFPNACLISVNNFKSFLGRSFCSSGGTMKMVHQDA